MFDKLLFYSQVVSYAEPIPLAYAEPEAEPEAMPEAEPEALADASKG